MGGRAAAKRWPARPRAPLPAGLRGRARPGAPDGSRRRTPPSPGPGRRLAARAPRPRRPTAPRCAQPPAPRPRARTGPARPAPAPSRVVARSQRTAGLELPVHPVDEVARGEELRVQPRARRGDRPVVLGLDPDSGGHQLPRRQLGDQPLGGCADAEADGLHRVQRRLEGHLGGQVRRRGAGVERGSALPHGPGATPGRRSGRSGAGPRRKEGPRGRRGCAARGGAAG